MNEVNNLSSKLKCPHCSTYVRENTLYCSSCGKDIKEKPGVSKDSFRIDIENFLLVFFLYVCYIFAAIYVSFKDAINTEIFISIGFLLLTAILFASFFKIIKPSLVFCKIKPKLLLKLVLIQIGFVFFAIYSSKLFLLLTETTETDSLWYFRNLQNGFLLAILFNAVFPAILEEIGFRAILYNLLSRLTTPRSVILVTGILFGFVHFAFFSYMWLIPFGLFLGWVRLKTGNIWYGVILHFLHNSCVTILEYYHFI